MNYSCSLQNKEEKAGISDKNQQVHKRLRESNSCRKSSTFQKNVPTQKPSEVLQVPKG
jgi:hypothetical protein